MKIIFKILNKYIYINYKIIFYLKYNIFVLELEKIIILYLLLYSLLIYNYFSP